jgi:uncharacterized membrane protein
MQKQNPCRGCTLEAKGWELNVMRLRIALCNFNLSAGAPMQPLLLSSEPRISAAVSRNLVKPFFIAGFILGEVYVAFLLLAPGIPPVHWTGAVTAILLFGPFAGAAGGGLGVLATGLWNKFRGNSQGPKVQSGKPS